MAGQRLPEGTFKRLAYLFLVAGIGTVGLVGLILLSEVDTRAQSLGAVVLLTLAAFCLIGTASGLAAWLAIRAFRHDPDLRRRQPNGRAQVTLVIGWVIAFMVVSLVNTLLSVGGAAELLVAISAMLVVLLPVSMLAKRFDPRMHGFPALDPTQDLTNTQREPDRRDRRMAWLGLVLGIPVVAMGIALFDNNDVSATVGIGIGAGLILQSTASGSRLWRYRRGDRHAE